MTLKTDIYTPGKKKDKKLIASKGEKVTLVADHDNVLIVECRKLRFTVQRENVSGIII